MLSNPAFNSTPKLLDQVRVKIRRKHYSIRTEQAYTNWLKRFILHVDKQLVTGCYVPVRDDSRAYVLCVHLIRSDLLIRNPKAPAH